MIDPPYLYRYRHLDGQHRLYAERIFLNNELYFASPSQLNDPFDCKVRVSLGGSDEELSKKLNQLFEGFEPSLTPKARERKVNWIIAKGQHRDPKFMEYINEGYQKMVNTLGVLSLTSKPDHILMWTHYSNDHCGYCLQFKHENEPFFGRAMPVQYSKKYLEANYLRDSQDEWVKKIFLTKAVFWNYEDEWRIYKFSGPGLYSFPPNLLAGVILGCQVSDEDKELIINWISQRRPRPHLYQARPKIDSFGLDIISLV